MWVCLVFLISPHFIAKSPESWPNGYFIARKHGAPDCGWDPDRLAYAGGTPKNKIDKNYFTYIQLYMLIFYIMLWYMQTVFWHEYATN